MDNPNTKILDGITYSSLGELQDIDYFKIFKNNILIKKIMLNRAKGLFGHKSELFSKTQTTKDIYNILSSPNISPLGIQKKLNDAITIKAFKGTKEVDISKMHTKNARTKNGTWGSTYLVYESKHLKIT